MQRGDQKKLATGHHILLKNDSPLIWAYQKWNIFFAISKTSHLFQIVYCMLYQRCGIIYLCTMVFQMCLYIVYLLLSFRLPQILNGAVVVTLCQNEAKVKFQNGVWPPHSPTERARAMRLVASAFSDESGLTEKDQNSY